jgi:hypothetical protein
MGVPLKFIGLGLLGLWYAFTVVSRSRIEKPKISDILIHEGDF